MEEKTLEIVALSTVALTAVVESECLPPVTTEYLAHLLKDIQNLITDDQRGIFNLAGTVVSLAEFWNNSFKKYRKFPFGPDMEAFDIACNMLSEALDNYDDQYPSD
jgi:hypothetical protein